VEFPSLATWVPMRLPDRRLIRFSIFAHQSENWLYFCSFLQTRTQMVCLRMNGRFAPIPVTHELISVFVKSYQRTPAPISCVTREPTTFCLGFFYFFLEFIPQIREKEQKLGPIAFLQRGPQLRDDPRISFRTGDYQAYLARTWSNDVDAILTRIPAYFGTSKRDVSQNRN
jgi:hypothetical protein